MTNASALQGKKPWLSKTIIVMVTTILATLIPQVDEWIAGNPTTIVQAVAAAAVLLRFVTSGKITISEDASEETSGGGPGVLPLGLLLMAGLCFTALPSCSGLSEYPVKGTIFYRDINSGAKAGLTIEPGQSAEGFVRVPIYDSETGEQIGLAEVSAPVVVDSGK